MASHLIRSHAQDDGGFERLYRAHVKHVYRYAYAITGSRADAEDVTQTTFLNAYRAYERGERPRAAENWLTTIAHNVCRQRVRTSARRPREVELSEELVEAPVSGSDAPTAADIRRAIRHLSPDEQTVIAMRELQGRTTAEIAVALGQTTAATERLVFRARRALREQLTETLTCLEAERAINRKLDGESSRLEIAALRRHLRECTECAALARRYRAQRGLLRTLGPAAFPTSLLPASAIGTKVAMIAAAVAVSGGGYEAARHTVLRPALHRAPARVQRRVHPSVQPPVHHSRAAAPLRAHAAPGVRRHAPAAAFHATPPRARPASPDAEPPTIADPPTPAPPAVVDGDAGGGASSTPPPANEPSTDDRGVSSSAPAAPPSDPVTDRAPTLPAAAQAARPADPAVQAPAHDVATAPGN